MFVFWTLASKLNKLQNETENNFHSFAILFVQNILPHIMSESKRIAEGILYKNENYCQHALHPARAGSSLINRGGDWLIVWKGLQAIGYPKDIWLYREPSGHANAEARLSFLLF